MKADRLVFTQLTGSLMRVSPLQSTRNNCQYCRFKKCLGVGMKKEGDCMLLLLLLLLLSLLLLFFVFVVLVVIIIFVFVVDCFCCSCCYYYFCFCCLLWWLVLDGYCRVATYL